MRWVCTWGQAWALVLIFCSSNRDSALLGGDAGYTFRRAQEPVCGVEELGRGGHRDMSETVAKTPRF